MGLPPCFRVTSMGLRCDFRGSTMLPWDFHDISMIFPSELPGYFQNISMVYTSMRSQTAMEAPPKYQKKKERALKIGHGRRVPGDRILRADYR